MRRYVKIPNMTKMADVVRMFGVSATSIRRFESEGLIPPVPRTPFGYRNFDAESIAALYNIIVERQKNSRRKGVGYWPLNARNDENNIQ